MDRMSSESHANGKVSSSAAEVATDTLNSFCKRSHVGVLRRFSTRHLANTCDCSFGRAVSLCSAAHAVGPGLAPPRHERLNQWLGREANNHVGAGWGLTQSTASTLAGGDGGADISTGLDSIGIGVGGCSMDIRGGDMRNMGKTGVSGSSGAVDHISNVDDLDGRRSDGDRLLRVVMRRLDEFESKLEQVIAIDKSTIE